MNHPIPETVALFGLPITNVTMAQAVSRVEEQIRSGSTQQIATANLDFARNSLKDPYLQRVICDCSMVLPDGAPMLWASSLFGAPLKQRVTGVDLIPELAKLSAERGYGIFLLGSSENSSRLASEVLTSRYPGVRIVGRYCPDVAPLHAMDNEELLRRIASAEPDILLVAFGNPKQEMWIYRHRDRLSVPVSIGIGGALDMIAGSLKRAPKWVQKVNLEWAYRMCQEPKRLFPRYFHDAIAFFVHLPLGLLATRMQPGDRREGTMKVEIQGTVRIISTPSKLCGEVSLWLAQEAKAAAKAGHTLIVDMSATIRVEADGLGGLLEARRIMLASGLWIWLTGMSNPVRRVLQFSAMSDLFRVATTSTEAIQYTRSANSLSPRSADSNGAQIPPGKTNVQSASIARAS
jgi:N-acetylglucosaminyldiphosphoundecaprenol N-acetyl-beta-D-mannosaminyltransferase